MKAAIASDILCYRYGTLSQSLQYPVKVADLLCGERVVSQTTLFNVKTAAWSHSKKSNFSCVKLYVMLYITTTITLRCLPMYC